MNKTLILVVEDDTPVHNLITTTLKTHDYKYISAKNGAGAIMEASTHNPDIVLLDLGLPDIDGVEVIEKIRSWSNMPIIVISARSEDSDKIEALDAGADDYLTKPFSVEELLDLKDRMERERPTPWEELPDLALYMDQIISYMSRQLIHFDQGEGLTSAMVNNYIKDGLVPRADGKRYGPVHLGYLTAVCALKKVLPVRDIGALLSAGQQTGKDNETLYHYFCAALDRALTDTAQTIDGDAQRGDLARMALDLALRSYAAQLACARILDILQPEQPEPGHKSKK